MVSIIITKTTNWTCLFCPDIINSETSNTETGIEKSITKSPVTSVTLSVESDRTELTVGETYDVACVRIKAVDQNGNVLPYFNEPVSFKTEGGVRLIGPALTSLRGGLGGTFVRTATEGAGALTVSAPGAPDVTVDFKIFKKSTVLV